MGSLFGVARCHKTTQPSHKADEHVGGTEMVATAVSNSKPFLSPPPHTPPVTQPTHRPQKFAFAPLRLSPHDLAVISTPSIGHKVNQAHNALSSGIDRCPITQRQGNQSGTRTPQWRFLCHDREIFAYHRKVRAGKYLREYVPVPHPGSEVGVCATVARLARW